MTSTSSSLYFSASQAGRQLARPTSQILKAVRSLDLPASRAGFAKNAAILLTTEDLVAIEKFLIPTINP